MNGTKQKCYKARYISIATIFIIPTHLLTDPVGNLYAFSSKSEPSCILSMKIQSHFNLCHTLSIVCIITGIYAVYMVFVH